MSLGSGPIYSQDSRPLVVSWARRRGGEAVRRCSSGRCSSESPGVARTAGTCKNADKRIIEEAVGRLERWRGTVGGCPGAPAVVAAVPDAKR
jgi:hypothetical protein